MITALRSIAVEPIGPHCGCGNKLQLWEAPPNGENITLARACCEQRSLDLILQALTPTWYCVGTPGGVS